MIHLRSLDRRCHSRADDRLGLAQHPERDVEPEHVAEHPNHLAPAHVTIGSQGRGYRGYPRAERTLRYPHGQDRTGGLAADGAGTGRFARSAGESLEGGLPEFYLEVEFWERHHAQLAAAIDRERERAASQPPARE